MEQRDRTGTALGELGSARRREANLRMVSPDDGNGVRGRKELPVNDLLQHLGSDDMLLYHQMI